MDITTPDKLAEIRRLNDQFRTTFRGGEILLTQSVTDMPPMVIAAALQKVAVHGLQQGQRPARRARFSEL
jgi:hypothetical protein